LALFEDLAKGVTPTGLAAGLGAVLLVPVLKPATSQVLRPLAKAMLSTGITLYRSAVEPITDAVVGLVTEAQLELARASTQPASAAETTADETADREEPRSQKHRKTHS
jgi:hypothetical protein